MSPSRDTRNAQPGGSVPDAHAEKAVKLRRLHEQKALAELAVADAEAPGSDVVAVRGALLADVVVVKGLAGPAEAAGGAAMSGADGDAAVAALEALGYGADTAFFTLSRPEPGIALDARARRLRMQVEAVDPAAVVAVDAEAAEDLAAAFGLEALLFGSAVRVAGRMLVAADGLEASLADARRKATVWRHLKAAHAEPPVY